MDIKKLLLGFIAVTGFFGICATPSAKAETSAGDFSFTVSPEGGTETDKLAKVVITAAEKSDDYYFTQTDFIEADDFPYADAGAYFICGETRVDATCNAMWSQDVTIVPSKAITAKGEWTLVIEPGALQWGYDDDDYVWQCVWTNEETLTYTYTVTGNADEQPEEVKLPFTTDPESGSTVKSLETVTLNFIPALDEYANNDVNPYRIYFAKDGEKLENISVRVSEKYSENKIVLTASEPITENGSYQLVIEARALDINYDEAFDGSYYFVNKEQLTFDYTIENTTTDFSFTVTPEAGTEMDKLAKVVIAAAEKSDEYYFTQTDFIEADDFPYADAGAYFICGETRVDASCNAMWSQDVTIVPVKAITAKGEWTLVIEPGALQWGYDDDDYVWQCV